MLLLLGGAVEVRSGLSGLARTLAPQVQQRVSPAGAADSDAPVIGLGFRLADADCLGRR